MHVCTIACVPYSAGHRCFSVSAATGPYKGIEFCVQCRRLSLTTRLTGKRKALDRLKDAPDPRAKAPELHQKIQDASKGIAKLV